MNQNRVTAPRTSAHVYEVLPNPPIKQRILNSLLSRKTTNKKIHISIENIHDVALDDLNNSTNITSYSSRKML